MSPETLKEAKNFKTQAGWCGISMWVATFIIAYMAISKTMQDNPWLFIPIPVCATIFTFIYCIMGDMINKHESLTKKD